MRGKNLFFFTLGAGCVAAGLWGLSVGALTDFTAGSPIRASEVNSNFTTLRTAIQALEQPVGVSRLAIGGTIGDGKVLTAQGGNLVWGDATGGAAFGANLTGNNAAAPGFKVHNEATNSTGIQGEVATTGYGVRGVAIGAGVGVFGETQTSGGVGVLGQTPGTGYGVRGVSDGSGVGVAGVAQGSLGAGVLGSVPGTGWGVRGISSNSGIGVEGESQAGPGAGVSAKASLAGTALLIDGSIGVRGNAPAFLHTATPTNVDASRTIIDNPMTNGDPNAMLVVTYVISATDPLITAPIGVYYDSGSGRWLIFRADGNNMPFGAKFNVLVIKKVP